MKIVKFALPALVFSTALMITSTASFGKVEYTKKEKKSCAFCHVTATSKELNEAGTYYKEKKTLEGYQAKEKK
jgi:hypothetical protein